MLHDHRRKTVGKGFQGTALRQLAAALTSEWAQCLGEGMDFDRLRYFVTVAQSGSIRGASELLKISPAALSKAIKLLESELDTKLILPSGRGIAISEQGRRLAVRGQSLLSEVQQIHEKLRDETQKEKPLRIGSFEVFTTYFLSQLLSSGLEKNSLVLHELVPGHLEKALVDDEVDLGITYIPIPNSGLEHSKVASISMGIYTKRGAFNDTAFLEIPFAIPVDPIHGSPNKVRGLDGWPEDKVKRLVRYRVTMMESALELCRAGLAASYLPKFVVHLHNQQVKEKFQLEELQPPAHLPSAPQPVYLIRRKTDIENEVHRKIAKALRLISQKN